jgi:hypothetical protein
MTRRRVKRIGRGEGGVTAVEGPESLAPSLLDCGVE